MKIRNKIASLLAGIALLTSCADDTTSPLIPTVGEANNAIVLSAGISEGGSGVMTRAVANPDANHASDPSNGGGHTLIANGAKMLLDVRGKWKRTDSGEPELVTKTTTITIGGQAATTSPGDKHNSISAYTPQLYWDDYGTADPHNATAGREEGLTIYGAGVNKSGVNPPTINTTDGSSWTNLTWTLPEDQSVSNTEWENYDLITSNNVVYSSTPADDNAYKFSQHNEGKLLEFTHSMSKITVNIKAGDGFSNNAFTNAPTVTVFGTYLNGTVNIESGTTVDITTGEKKVITLKKNTNTTETFTATYNGLIMPGNSFADGDDLLKINADDNIYYVTAKNINDANTETNNKFERGKNYIINVTLNKTKIEVSATVVDWVTVKAADESPEININTSYNGTGTATPSGFTSFSFYRSAGDPFASTPSKNDLKTYSKGYSGNSTNFYAPESVPTGALSSSWTMTPILYWPSHKTHYHFRGVWPQTVKTEDSEYTDGTYDWAAPRVRMNSAGTAQVIAVKNVKYSSGTFPSDLLIGAPVFTGANKNCNNPDHNHIDQSEYGICATTGTVTLDFKYMMSQVEVRMKTSTGNDQVNLNGAIVEIVDGYTMGDIQLGNGQSVVSDPRGSYTLDAIDGDVARDEIPASNIRHSAIVPQNLTWTESSTTKYVRFKITITNTDETKDIYYANIEPILKSGSTTEKIAPNGKWESGMHYIYTLFITKTDIKVTATLTDWITVTADEPIWF